MTITVAAHPLARVTAFSTLFPRPLGEMTTPSALTQLLRADAAAPCTRDEAVRQAVRDMLRVGGYKPTGRGKPAAEYLVRAAADETLDGINVAVDACNAVSLHSGLPISVVDASLARAPYRIAVAGAGERYVFNRAGQEIELQGLLCLYDADGACGNAVKDSQRTKTRPETVATLSVIWGVAGHERRLAEATSWYRELLHGSGATTEEVAIRPADS
jgi:DNA/RNA-binding domain of Phe-tRNA-synthetase-like protein